RRSRLKRGGEIVAEDRNVRSRSNGAGGSVARGVLDAVFIYERESVEDRHGEARSAHHHGGRQVRPGEITRPTLELEPVVGNRGHGDRRSIGEESVRGRRSEPE